jgi:hypothetical protein
MAIQETVNEVIAPITVNDPRVENTSGADSTGEVTAQSVEEKVIFVNNKISEHFEKHGLPSAADFMATTRTLRSAFTADLPREK